MIHLRQDSLCRCRTALLNELKAGVYTNQHYDNYGGSRFGCRLHSCHCVQREARLHAAQSASGSVHVSLDLSRQQSASIPVLEIHDEDQIAGHERSSGNACNAHSLRACRYIGIRAQVTHKLCFGGPLRKGSRSSKRW